jgi:hypothetical protein
MSDAQCGEFRELVSAFVDERLDGDELLRLEVHLLDCGDCRAFEADLRRLKGLLRAAEAFRPLRRPPPGFAALVAARIEREGQVVPFPAAAARQRRSRVFWGQMVAAAAAAALLFAWSWQRLVPVSDPEQRAAAAAPHEAVEVAAADGGSMAAWVREHAELTRRGTVLGPAEESDLARGRTGLGRER